MLKEKLHALENNPKLAPLIQFIKFGLVGVSNTLISYAVEMLCYYVLFARVGWSENTKIIVTYLLSFIISVTNAYYWNSRHVFAKEGVQSFRQRFVTYLKTVGCYALTGLLLAPWLKTLLVAHGVAYWLASLLTLLVTIPLNFLMNKLWAFK